MNMKTMLLSSFICCLSTEIFNSIISNSLFITLIEGFDSLLNNNEFGSKHVSFDDDDDSVDDGESMINSGRSRVTVPVRLCQ